MQINLIIQLSNNMIKKIKQYLKIKYKLKKDIAELEKNKKLYYIYDILNKQLNERLSFVAVKSNNNDFVEMWERDYLGVLNKEISILMEKIK